MIDFNQGVEKLNKYLGSERKTTIDYDGVIYMIKYPDPIRDKLNSLSYMNNQYSEHIGCRIFHACGIVAQETQLGYFDDINGNRKIVVGCKDFTQDGGTLYEFSKLSSQIMVDSNAQPNTIENVETVIDKSRLIRNKDEIKEGFWDMFVIDALIANPDRHTENWGVLETDGIISFAPIYDCGSALGALLSDEKMNELLGDVSGFKNQEFNVTSCYTMSGKRVFYHEIFRTPPRLLKEAIARVGPRIDLDKIKGIIYNVDQMSEVRKEYIFKSVEMRCREIIMKAV